MSRVTSAEAQRLIKQWEGLRLTAYQCAAGAWTIGWGHTGPTAQPGARITEDAAETLFQADLRRFEAGISELVKVPLSDEQHGALVSFAFNVGLARLRSSTLLQRLNAGRYDEVPAQLARWVYGGGKVLPGLVNRRAAEAGLWARGAYVASAHVEADLAAPRPVQSRTIRWSVGGALALLIPLAIESLPLTAEAFKEGYTAAGGGETAWTAGIVAALLCFARVVLARLDDFKTGARE